MKAMVRHFALGYVATFPSARVLHVLRFECFISFASFATFSLGLGASHFL